MNRDGERIELQRARRADLEGRNDVEKKPSESIEQIFNRVFGPPAERASLVQRPAPGLRHEPPPCVLTSDDKALLQSVVKLWLTGADLAITFARLLVAADRKPEAIAKAIWEIDQTIEKLPPGAGAASSQLRDMRDLLSRQRTIPEPEMDKAVRTLNQLIDAISPFTPLIEKVTKYAAKLQLAELGIERAFDAIEEFQFARDVRTELALRE